VALAARATSISAGDRHACARLVDGRVQCWGYNVNGQLGNGSATNTGTPVFVSGLATARSVRAGGLFTCAILADTTVRCWGSNSGGQLGDGTSTNRPTPVAVTGLTGAVALGVSEYSACALLGDGTARCWGYNSDGQLGDGTSTTRTAPVPVSGLTGVAEIAAGSGHSCARLADGTARCWGKNDHGQLGDGTTVGPRRTPVAVPGLTGLRSLSVATLTSCVVLADTSVSCWGYNALGLVGDGTTTDRPAPTPMVNLTGGLVCGAVAGAPGVETCNGADDDCDGIVDNVASMTCP
jgi:alpha-tubulin suppressor-like RCC1 family protein